MVLESTKDVTKISTRNIFLKGKGGRCVGLTNFQPSCADCSEILEVQATAALRACTGIALHLFPVLVIKHYSEYFCDITNDK